MVFALRTPASQLGLLAARATVASPRTSQLVALAAYGPPTSADLRVSQLVALAAYAPPASARVRDAQVALLIARAAGESNVAARVSQAALLIAYGTGVPGSPRSDSWTFVADGHRFWVLPLGAEGDWAFDTVTKEWTQLQTQGFPGLNFTHGVMWGTSRVMGGDALYPFLYELDPNQPDDEGWRAVSHVVTGGVQTRSTDSIGVANFRLAASIGHQSDTPVDVNLTFSDDNGNTWSGPFVVTIAAGVYNTSLNWPALGSFTAPGRVFRVSDFGGFLSIAGADASLNNYDDDDGDSNVIR